MQCLISFLFSSADSKSKHQTSSLFKSFDAAMTERRVVHFSGYFDLPCSTTAEERMRPWTNANPHRFSLKKSWDEWFSMRKHRLGHYGVLRGQRKYFSLVESRTFSRWTAKFEKHYRREPFPSRPASMDGMPRRRGDTRRVTARRLLLDVAPARKGVGSSPASRSCSMLSHCPDRVKRRSTQCDHFPLWHRCHRWSFLSSTGAKESEMVPVWDAYPSWTSLLWNDYQSNRRTDAYLGYRSGRKRIFYR